MRRIPRTSTRPEPVEAERRGLLGRSSRPLLLAMVGVRVAILVITIAVSDERPILDGDIRRFEEIATTDGTPYRDFPTEYAPVETLVIRALGGDGLPATVTRVAVVWFVCDLATAAALGWAWGMGTATTYLVLGLPLLTQMSLRLDPLVIVLAVAGFALARRGRERTGGVVLAVAVLTKVWPVFLVPALLIDRRRRALVWFVGAMVAGGVAWMAVSGIDAPRQVVSFRGATGWHIESAIGLAIWIVTGGPTRGELGAIRVGTMPSWARAGLGLATIGILVAVWTTASRRRRTAQPLGRPAVAALAGAVVASPVWAGHYVSWLLPWGAVAAGERSGRSTARTLFAVSLLTAFVGATLDFGDWNAAGAHIPVIKVALVAIHLLLATLVLGWVLRRHDTTRASRASGSGAPIAAVDGREVPTSSEAGPPELQFLPRDAETMASGLETKEPE